MNNLVSVIIPVYNVSSYIERCLNSVSSQSYNNIECIIVDDATPDDSISKCEKFVANYQGPIRFVIIHHSINRGLSAARNTGTKEASGDYVYYLDSDDDITPDCIEKLLFFVKEDETIQMVQGNYLMVTDGNVKPGKSVSCEILNNDDAREQFLIHRRLNEFVWNKLFKRSFIVDNNLYNKEGIINEDLLWIFSIIKTLKRAVLCKDITYYYRIRKGSIATSTNCKKQGYSYSIIYEEILHNLTEGKEKAELNGFLYNFAYNYAAYWRYEPKLKDILQLYMEQMRLYDCKYATFVLLTVSFMSKYLDINVILQCLNRLRLMLKR